MKYLLVETRGVELKHAWECPSLSDAVGAIKKKRLVDWQILAKEIGKRSYRMITLKEDAELKKLGAYGEKG